LNLTLKSTDFTAAGDPNVYGNTPPQLDRSVFSYDGVSRMLTAQSRPLNAQRLPLIAES